jgi:hypothetical protein
MPTEFLALAPTPLLEKATEFVAGRILSSDPVINAIAKIAPFAKFAEFLGKKKDTKKGLKEESDGRMVITVGVAIDVVEESLDGFVGTFKEFEDVIRGALGRPESGGATPLVPNLSEQIAQKLRENALRQDRHKHKAEVKRSRRSGGWKRLRAG